MNTSQKLLFNPMSFSLMGSWIFWLQCPHPLQIFPHCSKGVQKIRKKKKEHVESDSKFMVKSEKTKDTFYTCDMLSGYCSCPVGSTCAMCISKLLFSLKLQSVIQRWGQCIILLPSERCCQLTNFLRDKKWDKIFLSLEIKIFYLKLLFERK